LQCPFAGRRRGEFFEGSRERQAAVAKARRDRFSRDAASGTNDVELLRQLGTSWTTIEAAAVTEECVRRVQPSIRPWYRFGLTRCFA